MEGQKMRKVLSRVYRAKAHAAGKGGQKKRTIHDSEDTDGGWRGGLLQDIAFQSDSQIIQTKELNAQGISEDKTDRISFFMREYSEVTCNGLYCKVSIDTLHFFFL